MKGAWSVVLVQGTQPFEAPVMLRKSFAIHTVSVPFKVRAPVPASQLQYRERERNEEQGLRTEY